MSVKSVAGMAALVVALAGSAAAARPLKCARADEVTAIQTASVQQELMVAALTCNEISRFNAFQTDYGRELRASDGALLRMFMRLYGGRQGQSEYHAFKTRLANNSSIRSSSANSGFCHDAREVFAAALGPDRPSLAAFVSGIEVSDPSPVDSCQIQVAVGLAGVMIKPHVIPKPNPLRVAAAGGQAQSTQ